MKIRPIIFSDAMVRALLDGRKSQTRRLDSSPLRNIEPGDLLYVREAWRAHRDYDETPPREIPPGSAVEYMATGPDFDEKLSGRDRRGMHMPKWASRLTLEVRNVRFETLQSITAKEAEAEGTPDAMFLCETVEQFCARANARGFGRNGEILGAQAAFAILWDTLHGGKTGEKWNDNPDIVALTFSVTHENVEHLRKRRGIR